VPQTNPTIEPLQPLIPETTEPQKAHSFDTKNTPKTPEQLQNEEQRAQQVNEARNEAKTDINKQDLLKNITKRPKKQNQQKTVVRDELTIQIEKVMEDGLGETYNSLSVIQKQQFKIKAEETVFEIRNLMQKTKIKMKVILRLLLNWMKLIPGVNHFFLEQEAKIKADQIFRIHQRNQGK
tara:strand:- start:607 stop:1146 length:540 start_codon:yes stop_codon:yes gene_type:complete